MIRAMRYLKVAVFERLEITSIMDVDKIIIYMHRILRVSALKKYWQVLEKCNDY